MLVLFSTILLMFGCENNITEPKNQTGSQQATFEDFQETNMLFEEEEVTQIMERKAGFKISARGANLGRTKETALIPLVFDNYNKLHNKKSFKEMVEKLLKDQAKGKKSKKKVYFTDFTTYKAITNDTEFTLDDIFDFNEAFNTSGNVRIAGKTNSTLNVLPVYGGDPYDGGGSGGGSSGGGRTLYGTTKTNKNLSEVIPQNCLYPGDYAVNFLAGDFKYGHSALVSTVGNAGVTDEDTKVVEAYPPKVVEQGFRKHFYDEDAIDEQTIFLAYNSGTVAINYARKQIGEPFDDNYLSSKWNTNKWYCSKLVWRAYKEQNREIDREGGYWVSPKDLTGNMYFQYTGTW